MEILDLFRDAKNPRRFAAGATIFREGEPGDAMYVIVEGRVDVIGAGRVVETVAAGAILGEMAIISDAPRSATAVAATACVLVPVDQQHFIHLIRQRPGFAIEVMAVMAERLRRLMPTGEG